MANTFAPYPAKYLQYNQQLSKNLTIVMEIEGVPYLFGVAPTFTQVRYGDPNIVYGLPGLVYGGLRALGNLKPYIVLDSSFVISQRIEPEQGRGNIGTLTVSLIDYNGEVSRLVSPGVVIQDIIFKPQIRIWIGFAQTSFPEDFVLLFQGYCTTVTCPMGMVQLELSDATAKVRQPLFNTNITALTSDIDNSTTTIPVLSTSGFYTAIIGPDGNYDPNIFTYIVVDSEVMEYDATIPLDPTQFTVTRGQLGTVADDHENEAQVNNSILIGSNTEGGGIHFIDACLKMMLSGWNGPCETNIPIGSFNYIDPTLTFQSNAFTLASMDAIRDLGLSIGDYFTITGASNPANNLTGMITGFGDSVLTNQVIYTNQVFEIENTTSAVAAYRSQYDTFPVKAGLKMRMRDVDVATWQYVKNTYFAAGTNNISIYYSAAAFGKKVIQTDILLPMGCYGISRFGRASISVTKPPLPGVGKLVSLDWTNVINPQKIIVERSSNSRTFYNLISYQYNYDVASGNYTSVQYFLDSTSLNQLGGQVSQLPIVAPGLRDLLSGATIAQSRGQALLNRFKTCCIQIDLTVNWSAGSTIEVSDIVKLTDNGQLKIMNFETGERNLGVQLFEVIQRQYNIVTGNVDLQLLGGLGFSVDSRFGLYSPTSILNTDCTPTLLRLIPSYGQTQISIEISKWTPFFGMEVIVHSPDYSVSGITTLQGVSETDNSSLIVAPALAFTPLAGYQVDIAPYPTNTNPNDQAQYKLLYAHFSPSIPVTSGVSSTSFNVSPSDAALMTEGNTIFVRNSFLEMSSIPGQSGLTIVSQEVEVTSIVGTLVTVAEPLVDQNSGNLMTLDNTYVVEGVGYHDGLSFYRYG